MVPLIDPGLGLSRRERRAGKKAVWRRWAQDPWNGMVQFAVFLGVMVLSSLARSIAKALIDPWRWYHSLGGSGVFAGLLIIGYLLVGRKSYARCVRASGVAGAGA